MKNLSHPKDSISYLFSSCQIIYSWLVMGSLLVCCGDRWGASCRASSKVLVVLCEQKLLLLFSVFYRSVLFMLLIWQKDCWCLISENRHFSLDVQSARHSSRKRGYRNDSYVVSDRSWALRRKMGEKGLHLLDCSSHKYKGVFRVS